MLKVVCDSKIPFLRGVLEPWARVVYLDGPEINPQVLVDVRALLVRTRTKCAAPLLQNSAVEFIGTATIGHDHIDTDFCRRQGITWTNAPGCNATSVKEWVLLSLLEIAVVMQWDLREKILGVVGAGHVGSRVVRAAQILGMQVLVCDPPRASREGEKGFFPLQTLQDRCHILSFHVPLVGEGEYSTLHLANANFFKGLRPKSWIINSSRGEVIDNLALLAALQNGLVGGVALDVWENEPHPYPQLVEASFLATPHIAGYSQDGKANATTQVVQALATYFGIDALKKWPTPTPAPPEKPLIRHSGMGKSREEVLLAIMRQVYNIRLDDGRLRSSLFSGATPNADAGKMESGKAQVSCSCKEQNTNSFEELRNNYPARREISAFSFELEKDPWQCLPLLQGILLQ